GPQPGGGPAPEGLGGGVRRPFGPASSPGLGWGGEGLGTKGAGAEAGLAGAGRPRGFPLRAGVWPGPLGANG
ncbi:hypothetical protein ABTM94_19175, partial [Acinetobacter baumannii]